jgi:hypothetical protein
VRKWTVALLDAALVFLQNLQPSSTSTSDETSSAEPATTLAGSAEMRLAVLQTRMPQEERPDARGVSVVFIVPEFLFPIGSHAHEPWERADSSVLVSLKEAVSEGKFHVSRSFISYT